MDTDNQPKKKGVTSEDDWKPGERVWSTNLPFSVDSINGWTLSQIWARYGLNKLAVGCDTKPFYLYCLGNKMSFDIEKIHSGWSWGYPNLTRRMCDFILFVWISSNWNMCAWNSTEEVSEFCPLFLEERDDWTPANIEKR